MREQVECLLELVKKLEPTELPRLLGELREVETTALCRLSTPSLSAPDELLTVGEVAARMKLSRDYVYRHGRRWPFCRRQGRKLLFSSNGLDNFLKREKQR